MLFLSFYLFYFSLAIKLVAYLQINRMDLAEKTLSQMKTVEEDHCLITLSNCWLTLHNPKIPLQSYDHLISQINELSDKFGYSIKTYNILGCILMIKGENEKAHKLFDAAIQENNVFDLQDGDP